VKQQAADRPVSGVETKCQAEIDRQQLKRGRDNDGSGWSR
jgi:hypothetical protein